jgi:hypothetical protein
MFNFKVEKAPGYILKTFFYFFILMLVFYLFCFSCYVFDNLCCCTQGGGANIHKVLKNPTDGSV